MIRPNEKVLAHFKKRSERYNRSSRWVVDEKLLGAIFDAACPGPDDVVLDIATGTGLVARRFKGRVAKVIGLDVSPDMARQAEGLVDRLIMAPVEKIPLPDASVDVCVCRQGLQFADLPQAAAEIARVLRPGGRVALCHLAAYGDADAEDAFKIQALRNPARVNYFKPGDLEAALAAAGLAVGPTGRYESRESVGGWIDHGAGTEEERAAIRRAYREAGPDFKRLHRVEEAGGDILDTMLFLIVTARKP